MEDEWDADVLCLIEEDELALMVMMGEHIGYENYWIIDSRYSNHMIDDQSDTVEAEWPSEKEVLSDLDNIEEILPHKMGEQIVHFFLNADVPENPSDNDIGEQEVTQPSEPSENEIHLNNSNGWKESKSQIQSMSI